MQHVFCRKSEWNNKGQLSNCCHDNSKCIYRTHCVTIQCGEYFKLFSCFLFYYSRIECEPHKYPPFVFLKFVIFVKILRSTCRAFTFYFHGLFRKGTKGPNGTAKKKRIENGKKLTNVFMYKTFLWNR